MIHLMDCEELKTIDLDFLHSISEEGLVLIAKEGKLDSVIMSQKQYETYYDPRKIDEGANAPKRNPDYRLFQEIVKSEAKNLKAFIQDDSDER